MASELRVQLVVQDLAGASRASTDLRFHPVLSYRSRHTQLISRQSLQRAASRLWSRRTILLILLSDSDDETRHYGQVKPAAAEGIDLLVHALHLGQAIWSSDSSYGLHDPRWPLVQLQRRTRMFSLVRIEP